MQSTHPSRIGRSVLWSLACAIVLILAWSGSAAAADKTIEVQLDTKPLTFDVDPVIRNGSTLVQFRPLFEAMGLRLEWNSATKTITGTKDGLRITMKIGSTQADVNGQTLTLGQAPLIIDGNTMVPLRFIGESTGAVVGWNPYKPQVVVFTEAYWTAQGATRADVEAAIKAELERIKKEVEASQGSGNGNTPIKPVPVPAKPGGSGVYKPATSDKVSLSQLQGMYAGFRPDSSGYECGGMCWDLYTFLPGNKLVVGTPERGGPETISCSVDECVDYTISNGQLKIQGGETLPIAVENGKLVINDVELDRVKPVGNDLKLSKEYIHRGFFGLVGISGGSTSWTYHLKFNANGTFESDRAMIGTVQGGAPTTGGAGSASSGSYKISGNTLTLAYSDGRSEFLLFFAHDESLEDIQIGEENFYVD